MKATELPLSKRILIMLYETGRTFENPYRAVWERLNLEEPVSKRAVRTSLDRLKRTGRLERIEQGDKVLYRLTDGGRREILRYAFSRKKWDGKWRMVAFDIPERRRRARYHLRESLLELGFRQFQESVWIGPFDVLDEVREIRDEYGIRGYVKLLTVESIEGHDDLKRKFRLGKQKNQKTQKKRKE